MHYSTISTSTKVRNNLIKLPNFLIVGAGKSGSTSIYHYLKQHPEIYMSPIKEPRFMAISQLTKYSLKGMGDKEIVETSVKTFNEYKRLFENVNNEKAVGEASPVYLYLYEDATKQIKKYLGEVKIIIVLRNLVERAFSRYMHLIRDSREFLSFEDGLKMEEKRIEDGWLPCWHYTHGGFLYNGVKAYMENFSQVRVYLHDDLQKDTLALIKDIYEFLEVDPSFIPDIKIKHNVSGIPRSRFIHSLNPDLLKTYIKPILKPFLPKRKRRKLIENLNTLIENLKIKNLEKPQMKPETREYLRNLYREDILKLQDLINRDLSHWLR